MLSHATAAGSRMPAMQSSVLYSGPVARPHHPHAYPRRQQHVGQHELEQRLSEQLEGHWGRVRATALSQVRLRRERGRERPFPESARARRAPEERARRPPRIALVLPAAARHARALAGGPLLVVLVRLAASAGARLVRVSAMQLRHRAARAQRVPSAQLT